MTSVETVLWLKQNGKRIGVEAKNGSAPAMRVFKSAFVWLARFERDDSAVDDLTKAILDYEHAPTGTGEKHETV